MPVVLALLASLTWGSADFIGGTTSRDLPAATVMLWSTAFVLPVFAVFAVFTGDLQIDGAILGWGILAGISGSLGIASLYQGLATGVMGVVAPISTLSVLVPVAVGLATGDSIAALQGLGIVVAIVGVVLAGGPHLRDFRTGGHRPVLWALAAALGIGVSLVALKYGGEQSAVSTLLVQRMTYVVVMTAVMVGTGDRRLPDRSHVLPLTTVGGADLFANGLFTIAVRTGPLSLVSVLASVYPVATLLLARQFQHERLTRLQAAGVICAFVGVAAVVAG